MQGIGKVDADVKARTVTFEYDPSVVAADAIQQAMNVAGYDSTVIA